MSPWLETKKTKDHESDADNDAASSGSGNQPNTGAGAGADTYKLSAVVMHVGGPAAGHYYAYVRYRSPASTTAPPPPGSGSRSGDELKTGDGSTCSRVGQGKVRTKQQPTSTSIPAPAPAPTPSSTWVKLDDHRVTKVSEAEVLRDAFGGGGGVYTGPGAELQGFFGQVVVFTCPQTIICAPISPHWFRAAY